MNKQDKLRRMLDALSPQSVSADFKEFDEKVAQLKTALSEKIQAKTIDDVQKELNKFKKQIDVKQLVDLLTSISDSVKGRMDEFSKALREEIAVQQALVNSGVGKEDLAVLSSRLDTFASALATLQAQKDADIKALRDRSLQLVGFVEKTNQQMVDLLPMLGDAARSDDIKSLRLDIDKVKKEINNRINNMPHGGNANRNVAIGGNTSVLSRYTDINLKAGNNVTISYATNDVTKYTDVTVSATGGGGSVGGTVRSINRVTTSQTAGDSTGTDYVYNCTAGVNITLPTAVGNTNLYTVKNLAASSVLVTTTAGQTIDGDATIILATQYTAVDLVNDGNNNWSVT